MASAIPRILVDDASADASSNLFAAALTVAFLIHLILILGVSFAFPHSEPGNQTTRPLEFVVLRRAAPSETKPQAADAFAQVDREGGGVEKPLEAAEAEIEPVSETAEPTQALDQATSLPPPRTELAPAEPEPLPQLELLAPSELGPPPIPEPPPAEPLEEPPVESEPPQVTATEILASRNLEIAALTAKIQQSSAAYAHRPRRKAVSASTREYKYASYLEAWRRKVVRIGNLNYPEEAKRHKMHGSLILHVAIRADGSVERIRVVESSGFDLLDEAAVKIVELAAPFAPFPPDIRAETDVLDITRTWQFLSSNRLDWGN
jgi:protein TonB